MKLLLNLHQAAADALPSWPAVWGVPLPRGAVSNPASLALQDTAGENVPMQARDLATHADGSVRRLLVTAEPAVPGPGTHAFYLRTTDGSQPAGPGLVSETGLHGAIGDVVVEADRVVIHSPFGIYELVPTAENGAWSWQRDDVETFEDGAVCGAVVVRGALVDDGGERLHCRLTLRVFGVTPVLACDVLLLHLGDDETVAVGNVTVAIRRRDSRWTQARYEVRQRAGDPSTADLPLHVNSGKLTVTSESGGETRTTAARLLQYNETWFSVRDATSRMVVGLPNFFEYYPYAVRIEAGEFCCDLWPSSWPEPWRLAQGAGKTHTVLVALLPSDEEPWSDRAVGYAAGKPPMAHTPLETLQMGGVGSELTAYMPDRYPRMETTLYDLVHNRNRGYGKMHWGDDFSALYTNQLRGDGEVVWNNLEGDYPYHLWCQFARTGQHRYYKEFRDSIIHWADVDFCDRHSDPGTEGALHIHSAHHWTKGASPCHNWAEGFKEWYFATGDPRPLEILEKMAQWIRRRAEGGAFTCDPQPYVRACGWGLIQMTAMLEILADDTLRSIALDLCERLLAYCRDHDGLVMAIPVAGWVPRDNAFHTATVVIGATMLWQQGGERVCRELAVAAAEAFMDERTCTPEGIAVYISGPEQDFPMQQAATFAMGALACAWHLTNDERFVRRGMRMLEYCLDRGMIVDHMRIPGEFIEMGDDVVLNVMQLMPNTQLLSYQLRGLLLFMKAADETGMLADVDYRY